MFKWRSFYDPLKFILKTMQNLWKIATRTWYPDWSSRKVISNTHSEHSCMSIYVSSTWIFLLEICLPCWMFWKKEKYIALNCSIFYTLVKYKLPEDGGHDFYSTQSILQNKILMTRFWVDWQSPLFGDVRMHARLHGMKF